MVWGSSLLNVSGNFNTHSPDSNIGNPIMIIGAGSQSFAKWPKNGAHKQKTLAVVDANPRD